MQKPISRGGGVQGAGGYHEKNPYLQRTDVDRYGGCVGLGRYGPSLAVLYPSLFLGTSLSLLLLVVFVQFSFTFVSFLSTSTLFRLSAFKRVASRTEQ